MQYSDFAMLMSEESRIINYYTSMDTCALVCIDLDNITKKLLPTNQATN